MMLWHLVETLGNHVTVFLFPTYIVDKLENCIYLKHSLKKGRLDGVKRINWGIRLICEGRAAEKPLQANQSNEFKMI